MAALWLVWSTGVWEVYLYVSSFVCVCTCVFIKKKKKSQKKIWKFDINSTVLALEQKHDNIVLEADN